jgi:hypothetical protein
MLLLTARVSTITWAWLKLCVAWGTLGHAANKLHLAFCCKQLAMKQGCLNGRPTVKFTVRTSFSSGRLRTSAFTPRMRIYPQTVLTVRVGKNKSVQTYPSVRANVARVRADASCVCADALIPSSPLPPPPVPSPPPSPTDAVCCLSGHGRGHSKKIKENYY